MNRRAIAAALLGLAAGCSTPAHVPKPFVQTVAGLPQGLAREATLLAGPEPTFSFMAGSTDMQAAPGLLLRRSGTRALSGGWSRAQVVQLGTALLSGETQSHRFPAGEDPYVQQRHDALYLLGGLVAAGVQRSDTQGFFGFQATTASSVRGSIFPMAAGKAMSFVLEGKTQTGVALSTRTTIRVLRELGNAEPRARIGGPLFLVAIERDGMLGLAPEIAYEIDWSRGGQWPRVASTECVLYSEAFGWPLKRTFTVDGAAGGFDRPVVTWEARAVSRRSDAPYAATNKFPVVRDGTTASSVLDAAYPQHRKEGLANVPAAEPLSCLP